VAVAEGLPIAIVPARFFSSYGAAPNDLWCADFKGEFKLGNGRYCYPLTVTDHASRFLLLCEALESTREDLACIAFERLFRERGLPLAIRSDNGVPFASPNSFSTSPSSLFGGLGLASRSSASSRAIRSRTAERANVSLLAEPVPIRTEGAPSLTWLTTSAANDRHPKTNDHAARANSYITSPRA
jgi:hypothetical protein